MKIVRVCLCLSVVSCFVLPSVYAADAPPATTLLFAPPGATGVALSTAGAEDVGTVLWHNPAGLVHLRYRELNAGLGSNSNGFNLHTGYFNPGRPRLGMPLAWSVDALSANLPTTPPGVDQKLGDATMVALSAGTARYLAARLSAGMVLRPFFLDGPGGGGAGAVADFGLLYRPGEFVRFSYGIKNVGPDVNIPGTEGDMLMTQLFGVHVKAMSRGNIALDIVVGKPGGRDGFYTVGGSYRLMESFGLRFSFAGAESIPAIDGRSLGFFFKTHWGRFDVSYQMSHAGNYARLSWNRHAARPPAEYSRALQTRVRARVMRKETVIYGEESPAPAKAAKPSKGRPDKGVEPAEIRDESSPAVAVPLDEAPPETRPAVKPGAPRVKSAGPPPPPPSSDPVPATAVPIE